MTSRRRAVLLVVALAALGLLSPQHAAAGYAVQPSDGSTVGPRPSFLVSYEPQESLPYVEVSRNPDGSGYAGACVPTTPFGEPYKFTCALYGELAPGTYYWTFSFWRDDRCQTLFGSTYCYAQEHTSGPFRFTVAAAQTPAAPATTPDAAAAPEATATWETAARLPLADAFDGTRSVKHGVLTRAIFATMRQVASPRLLAVACWTKESFDSVYASIGGGDTDRGTSYTAAFWFRLQPRWLHLSQGICEDVQRLIDSGAATGRNAGGLAVALHEAVHAYGVENEAQANCYAVQLVSTAGLQLGLPLARARYLGSLAVRFVRATAPAGYWNAARCRDGGAWDLAPGRVNLR